MRQLTRLLLPAFVAVGLAPAQLTAQEIPSDRGVRDDAGLFTDREALRQVRAAIDGIKRDHGVNVLIESAAALPEDKAEKFKTASKEEQRKIFAAWVGERFRDDKANGVYVLICRQPSRFYIRVGAEAFKKSFPRADLNRLESLMSDRFYVVKDYDAGLREGVKFVAGAIRRNLADRPPAVEAVTPQEAARRHGQTVAVEFFVRSTGSTSSGSVDLNTEPSWKADGNLIVRFPKEARERFWWWFGIADVRQHFKGKPVRVTGEVRSITFDAGGTHPVITVVDVSQIEVIKPTAPSLIAGGPNPRTGGGAPGTVKGSGSDPTVEPGEARGNGKKAIASAQPAPTILLDAGGHIGNVHCILFTPDDRRLVSVSTDGGVRVWNLQTGRTERMFYMPVEPGYRAILTSAAFSPIGSILAIGGANQKVFLIDFATARLIRTLDINPNDRKSYPAVGRLTFSPDGSRLAVATTIGTVHLFHLGRDEHVELRGHRDSVEGLAFSPDGRRLATGSNDHTARIWSVPEGKPILTIPAAEDDVKAVDWSPGGDVLATASFEGGVLRLWDAATGRPAGQIPLPGKSTMSCQFVAGGTQLLANYQPQPGKNRVGFFDRETGQVRRSFVAPTVDSAIATVAASHDGKVVAAAGTVAGGIMVWRADTAQVLHVMAGVGRPKYAVGWSADGTTLAWGSDLYPVERQKLNDLGPLSAGFGLTLPGLQPLPASIAQASVPEGQFAVEFDGEKGFTVKSDGKVARTFTTEVSAMSYSPVGRDHLLVGARIGFVFLYNLTTGKPDSVYDGHSGHVWAVAVAPDGKHFATASADRTVRVWAVGRQKPVLSIFTAGDEWIAWTPEGYYAASPNGEGLMGWQIITSPDQLAEFHPAARFRNTFYRPDVIRLLLKEGSVEKALAAADRVRGAETRQAEVAQVLPPRIAVAEPARSGLKLTTPALTVRAAVEPRSGQTVTAVRLLLDGRPIRSLTPPHPTREKIPVSWTIDLPPGEHTVAVEAIGPASRSESDPVTVTYTPAGGTSGATGTLHVLAIGINAYPGTLRLDAAAPDAQAISEAFRRHSQRLFKDVAVKALLDKEATRANILAELDGLRGRAKPGDVAVVFYAGHGDAKQAGSFHLLPVDADVKNLARTAVSIDDLRDRLQLPCPTVLILDACFSGAVDQRPAGRKKTRPLPEAADRGVRELTYDEKLLVFCGAAKDQEAVEEKGRGYFTAALVEGLSGKAASAYDGLVSTISLRNYVYDRVRMLSDGDQTPTFGGDRSTVPPFGLAKP